MPTTIAPVPKLQFFDANGDPLAGGKLYSYSAGTTAPLATYTDYGGVTPNANPVILDSRGEASVWLGISQYKLKLTTSTNVEVWTVDNIGGPDQATLAQLAASGGSDLIGFLQAGAGAQARTVQAKLRDTVSILDFAGVDPTGVTGSSAGIQAAIDSGANTVLVPEGTYLINATIIIPDDLHLRCDAGSVFKPSVNNLVMFTTKNYSGTKHAYLSQVWHAQLDADGKTGVVGFDMYGFRHAAGIFFPKFFGAFNHCIKFSELCWDTIIDEPFGQGCVNGILLAEGTNSCQVRKPGFDGLGSSGYGIKIQGGALYPSVTNVVLGGYFQGFSGAGGIGCWDAGSGTTIGTYGTCFRDIGFEQNAFADIYFDKSLFASAIGCQHFVSIGQNAYYGRNCEGVRIYSPLMTSGSRSVGLYNFDTSNVGCFGDRIIASVSGINLPVGTVSGIGSLPSEEWGTFVVTVVSSGGASTGITYGTRLAKWHRIGQRVNVNVQVSWSGWTGAAGNIVIRGTPAFLVPTSYAPTGIGVVIGLMTWAGANLYCYLNGTAQDISIVQNTTAGAITALPMAAAGDLAFDLTYSI